MATSTIPINYALWGATVVGEIVKSNSTGTTIGYGAAFCKRIGKLIIIDFEAQITTAGSASVADVGINMNVLHAINSSVPTNITAWNSPMSFFTSSGTISTTEEGYAGLANAVSGAARWNFARYYNTSGSAGPWADSRYTVGMRVKGTLYGQLS